MKTIYKYELSPLIANEIRLPINAEILDIQAQGSKVFLWVLLDPSRQKEARRFMIYGTGHEVNDIPQQHIGTVQIDGLVFHVFELI